MTPSFGLFRPHSAFSRCLPRHLFTHLCLSFSFLVICTFKPGTFSIYRYSSSLIFPPSVQTVFFFVLPSRLSGSIFHSLLSLWSFLPICLFEMDTRTTNTHLQILAHVPACFQSITGTTSDDYGYIQSVCVCLCPCPCFAVLFSNTSA